MALSIRGIVRVSATIAAGGVSRKDFGSGLFLTTDATLPAGGTGKVRSFDSLVDVGKVFGASTEPYLAATAWFSQDPFPRSFKIARWASADVATTLRGGTPDTVAAIGVLGAQFGIGGINVTVDLSGATTYAAIATALQTAIVALASTPNNDNRFSGATVTYDTNAFLITLSGPSDIGAYLEAGAGGTDISGYARYGRRQ